jgi:HAMP domain-containing protein
VWAVFGDLMAGLLGAFVLILVLVIGVQLELASRLEAEVQQRQTLEQALAGPLAGGRVTLANGRIGISGSVLFADGSDQLQPEGRQLLASLAADERSVIEARIAHILAEDARHGSYALIDYVHFKGEGTSPAERYAGAGWGLLQVLQEMPSQGTSPLADFVRSAEAVLARRVANAPPERNEQRWLEGWNNRLGTYLAGSRTATGIRTEQ